MIVRKHRDGETGPVASFRLEKVDVAHDASDSPITSCVVVPAQNGAPAALRRPHHGTAAGKALNELDHLILEGKYDLSPAMPEYQTVCTWLRSRHGEKRAARVSSQMVPNLTASAEPLGARNSGCPTRVHR